MIPPRWAMLRAVLLNAPLPAIAFGKRRSSMEGIIMRRTTNVVFAASLAVSLAFLSGCGSGDESAVSATIPSEQSVGGRKSKYDNVHPQIVIHTSAGDMTAELDGEKAPLTVANFLAYVERGQYEHSVFHQVEPGFLILGGGYDARLEPLKEDAPIRNEAHNGLKNTRGTIAMGREADIDSSTCRFFVNLGDNAELDHKGRNPADYGYCVFGKISAGLEIADKISELPTKQVRGFAKLPNPPVEILSVERIR
jgi:peptidyl-prolyl cis-trans isomerase A (cyclophilin A)